MLDCAGAPEPVVINAVRNACFDFCRDSLWLNEFLPAVSTTAGVGSYTLTPPTDTMIVSVLNLNYEELGLLYPQNFENTVAARRDWASQLGTPQWFVQPAPDVVTLVNIPDRDGSFVAMVAFAPTRAATTVDAKVYNMHLETIKYGALWKLKQISNQPWSDPAGASAYAGMFWKGVNTAAMERNVGNSRSELRVAQVAFV